MEETTTKLFSGWLFVRNDRWLYPEEAYLNEFGQLELSPAKSDQVMRLTRAFPIYQRQAKP